jgi:dipeptidyl-peptidase-4
MRLRLSSIVLASLPLLACGGSTDEAPPTEPETPVTAAAPTPPEDQSDPDFLEQFTVTYRFGHGAPGGFRITPDETTVLYMRSGARTFVNDLYALDVATGAERVLLTAEQILNGGVEELSAEERARRERMRMAARGITSFDLSPDGATILVPLSGRLFLVERSRAGQDGSVRELVSTAGSPTDPRFSPDGRSIAVVRDGDLYVMDVATGAERRLTQRAGEHVEYGTAEFVAQEEMSRFEGYWWSPDSATLLVEESDTSGVETMHILDPMHPEAEPDAPPYPRPGHPNAVVRLGFVSASARTPQPLRYVQWDAQGYPYLATVRWPAGGVPVILVQNRAQQDEILFAVDQTTGGVREIFREHDDAWLNLDQDAPRFLEDGQRFLWTTEREGEWRVELRHVDGSAPRALTPTGFGYGSLLGVDEAGQRMFVTASAEPTEMHVFEVSLAADAGAPRQMTEGHATHEAVFSRTGALWVDVTRTLTEARTAILRRTDGTTVATFTSTAESPSFVPNATIETVGEREYRAMVVRPRTFDPARRYAVLVNVYGGPGVRQVGTDRDRWLLPQWFADHGFIVVSFDGRGTPGRGRAWERAIRGDFGTIPLEDQVTALQALGALHPEMDMERVGIFGWSFGGYFSAMAVLRRPDVFRAGVAGAPVTEWRDYDTHYTERYLGLPEADDAEGPYRLSSVLTYAAVEEGDRRPMLIVHGTADDNVYFSHSIRLSDALFRAGRPFELLPLAGLTHMVPEPVVARRLQGRIADFFVRELYR